MKSLFVIETEERKLIIQRVSPVLYDFRGTTPLPEEVAIIAERVPECEDVEKDTVIQMTMEEAKELIYALSTITGYHPLLLLSNN